MGDNFLSPQHSHQNNVIAISAITFDLSPIWRQNRDLSPGGNQALKILQNPRENTCARPSILIKLQVSGLPCDFIKKETYLKRSLMQMFSFEFSKISRMSFLQSTSGLLLLKVLVIVIILCFARRLIFHPVSFNPLSANPTRQPTNCLSVFYHFVGVVFKE